MTERRLVDVDDLMDKLCSLCQIPFWECKPTECVLRQTLIAQPAVTVPTWIPVSERKPEKPQTVLVTDGAETWVAEYSADHNAFFVMCGADKNLSLTHWMPLPAPPKEGSHAELDPDP